eukprot:6382500-Amphidinium_carterae.1
MQTNQAIACSSPSLFDPISTEINTFAKLNVYKLPMVLESHKTNGLECNFIWEGASRSYDCCGRIAKLVAPAPTPRTLGRMPSAALVAVEHSCRNEVAQNSGDLVVGKMRRGRGRLASSREPTSLDKA